MTKHFEVYCQNSQSSSVSSHRLNPNSLAKITDDQPNLLNHCFSCIESALHWPNPWSCIRLFGADQRCPSDMPIQTNANTRDLPKDTNPCFLCNFQMNLVSYCRKLLNSIAICDINWFFVLELVLILFQVKFSVWNDQMFKPAVIYIHSTTGH